jgi:5-methyltetrahydropteroyltriglutamate--homocysteine methyltransferase
MATAINKELQELVAAGCSVIQVEEPTIHFIACYHPEATETLNFLTEVLNHELLGLDAAEVWIHTCWGNPMMQRVFDKTSYANALEVYLDRINCDVLTLEMKDRAFAEIELLGAWKGKTRKKLAIGVVSHRTLNAETPEEVAQDIRKVLRNCSPACDAFRRICRVWSCRRETSLHCDNQTKELELGLKA